ncbi:uncharacterized protein A4U43_C08F30780 [Asparagus officinalis]|uniref:uncharacterized protein LOC109819666 n=1 Tax=Asparagus officinalis TaxID=4686 RepID=UPI00098E7AB1|nr:uncharacterized protein LOC109819666 [Asparagus officinalis]ONK61520.1 uncharacterized protein A4U43_C08F30780 [Asparagus officinalis]
MIINHRLPFSVEAESLQRFAKLSISSEFPLSSPQFSEFGYSQRVHKSLVEQKIMNFRLSDLKYCDSEPEADAEFESRSAEHQSLECDCSSEDRSMSFSFLASF